ncbi:putative catecholamine binding [Fragilaria crotonensis]|nr:putative catecholamine binding [Fragilaria crotonensis]
MMNHLRSFQGILTATIAICMAIMSSSVLGESTSIFDRKGGSSSARTSPSNAVLDHPSSLDVADLARIVGGVNANPESYPFFTYIEISIIHPDQTIQTSQCGGTLVAPDIVLTAAHCFNTTGSVAQVIAYVNFTNYQERTGYEYERDVSLFQQHPAYDKIFTNDVAVLLLAEPVTQVIPITLNADPTAPSDGANVEVIGVGSLYESVTPQFPQYLQVAELQTVDSTTCKTDYARILPINGTIELCAAALGKDSCQGDSGGPLLSANGESFVQVGIVSFGTGCAEQGYPGVYSRVSYFLPYIQSEICRLSRSPPDYCVDTLPTDAPTLGAMTTSIPTTAPTDAVTTNVPVSIPVPTNVPTPLVTEIAATDAPTPAPTETVATNIPAPVAMPTNVPDPLVTETTATDTPTPGSTDNAPIDTPTLGSSDPTSTGSRSIQISRTGQVIATSSNQGPMRFSILDGQDFTMGLPGGLLSMDDLSISNEGFLFGLSIDTPALCSFQIETSSLTPISCITGDWSQGPFTGISALGGYIVISGGEGGMTVARYDTTSGIVDSTLDCMNCTMDGDDVLQWPDVKLMMQEDGTPAAILSTIWKNNEAGIMLVDLSTQQEIGRVELDYSMESNLGVAPTDYPLVSDFYDMSQIGTRTLYVAHGEVLVHQIQGGTASVVLEPPFNDFIATCLSVDKLNGVLVVGGSMNQTSSALAVYDILETEALPQLRVAKSVQGQVLSVSANAGKVAYVTAETPAIVTFDASASSMPATPKGTESPGATMTPSSTAAPAVVPSSPPTGGAGTFNSNTADCSGFRDNPIQLVGNDLVLHAIINPLDKTLIAELVYLGQAWLSLGFTPGYETMIGAQAVIGWPDNAKILTNPGKYNMTAESESGVVLIENSRQTLANATIIQNGTHTVLTFAKFLEESDENSIPAEAAASLVWAVGTSNSMGIHGQRGGISAKLNQCVVDSTSEPPETPSNAAAPAPASSAAPASTTPSQSSSELSATSSKSTTVDCTSLRDNPVQLVNNDLVMHAIINPVDKVLIAELVYLGQGWLSLGFAPGYTTMIGAQAVIGWPNDALSLTNPGKYDMTSESESGVVLMDNSRQTLENATIVQNGTHTVLTFTKLLEESNENSISATGPSSFVWAVGTSNGMGIHGRRGGISLTVNQCIVTEGGVVTNAGNLAQGVASVNDDNRSLWIAHGATASTAWGILVPLAIGSALIRKLLEAVGLPKGIWFSLHRGLNILAALLTIVSFSIAVYIFNKEPGAVHFTEDPHQTWGLVIFILTLIQALNGIFRPHLAQKEEHVEMKSDDHDDYDDYDDSREEPESPQVIVESDKSTTRIIWEYGHKILGVALLAMSWWQVQDGIGLFLERFPDDNDLTPVFWGVVIGISTITAALFIVQIYTARKTKR